MNNDEKSILKLAWTTHEALRMHQGTKLLDDEEGMALKEEIVGKLRMNFSSRKSKKNKLEAVSEGHIWIAFTNK